MFFDDPEQDLELVTFIHDQIIEAHLVAPLDDTT